MTAGCRHGVAVGTFCMPCGETARHLDLSVLVDHEGHDVLGNGALIVARARAEPVPVRRTRRTPLLRKA